jgi:hypothetical protein
MCCMVIRYFIAGILHIVWLSHCLFQYQLTCGFILFECVLLTNVTQTAPMLITNSCLGVIKYGHAQHKGRDQEISGPVATVGFLYKTFLNIRIH